MVRFPRTTGFWLALALTLLAGLIFVDLNVAAASQTSCTQPAGFRADEQGVIDASSVRMSPGSVMTVHPGGDLGSTFSRLDFYIVEAGQAQAFFQNRTPSHVYVHRTYDAATPYLGPVYFERPVPPPDVQAAPFEYDCWRATPTSGVDHVDMVWVLQYAPQTELPTTDEGWKFFRKSIQRQNYYSTPWVSESWAVTTHEFVIPLLYLLAAAVIVLGALYVRDLVLRASRQRGASAEAGLGLVELGGRFLRTLRALLIGLGLPLLYVCWASLFVVWGLVDEGPAPSAAWGEHLHRLTFVVLAIVVVGWATLLFAVQQAYTRWRHAQAQRPLEA